MVLDEYKMRNRRFLVYTISIPAEEIESQHGSVHIYLIESSFERNFTN